MNQVLTETRPIRLKGRSFLAMVLSPELPLDGWLERLDDLARRSSGFFLGRPVVLDMENLAIERAQLVYLLQALNDRGVWIMGVEGARPSLLGPGMPPAMRGGQPASDFEAPAGEPQANPGAPEPQISQAVRAPGHAMHAMPSMVITEPVRSGQSVYFPEGDITIVGSVASGAEVVAGGSIHIYGTLRGRALAGTAGNTSARIFCRKLEAELVAIDGLYKTAEDLEPRFRGQAVQLWLDGDYMMIDTLS
ncbi:MULTISPECIES: septum site-determining protein MinC [unclassified Brucella]|uniref:septum site-determining protein MinC n=1 Tax=unclassified Brucella TaxID=2632610 RepID=UPI0012AE6BBB|nr:MULTISPECIES: septum site-determining protein MinC [unclassified Brucella]MRN44162.1 septum formation inhibitor MinC [Brucella sp. 09RB8913]MRN57780.1 septum formation inhibitor MinC [Brucella sp. 09RB8918]CAB4326715.1 septum formation inhibitor [Brucella sp. 191011898]